MADKPLGLGVAGFGGFALYALQHFVQVEGVRIVGMASTHREAAYAAAQRFGIPDPVEFEELIARPEVDLVYIATPPFLHHPQARLALEAGKHVICEKPLALTIRQAKEMVALAMDRDLLLIANLMQRYNPLYDRIDELISSEILGEMLHGYFENYATDEGLPPTHWFWDQNKSGGIFIEHGVHFFDMFNGWLGFGKVEAAQVSRRSNTNVEDQVACTVRYRDTILVNFYHGFTQPGRMDRQEMRLVFERGAVTLYHWVPTQVHIHAVADEAGTRRLLELFPAARLDITDNYPPKDRLAHGRHKPLDLYQKFDLYFGDADNKMVRYGELLRAMMADQIAWIRDRSHRRRITEENAFDSLAIAVDADNLARRD